VGYDSADMRTSLGLFGVVLATLCLVLPRSTVLAQHETASDLVDGERAFKNSCATCHGPDGDLITGIDLGRGRFRRQMSDADLVRTIRSGIPNTAMPATPMTEEQATRIVAYLRSRAAAARGGAISGEAARGKALFDGKGNCASCHRVAAVGSRVGPDLTGIGAVRGAAELERSLVDPGADVQPNNRSYRVVLRDGTTVEGRLLGHDTFNVQMIDTREQLRSFVKSDLRQYGFLPSPMPSYRGTLGAQEIADVVSYLASLRGR
jgi:putative heme-binding domain-containing protein